MPAETVSPATVPAETDSLAQLIADARLMPAAMLPRPRVMSAGGGRTIDLAATEVTIPDATALLVDGFEPYGT